MSTVRRLRATAPLAAAGVGSLAVATWAYELWRARLGVPLSYSGDSLAYGMNVRHVVDHPWVFHEPRLGAPFGQHFQDWPFPEVLQLAVGKLLSLFTDNWAAVVNGMFILSFPLVAVTACWVFRRIGIDRWLAAALGILYSVLPYHLVRGENHLVFSGYFGVPLAVWLALSILDGRALFPRGARASWVRTLALCVLVGVTGAYYAAFTLLFVVVALAVRFLRDRDVRELVSGLVVCGAITAVVVAATLPTTVYRLQHGANPVAAKRLPYESDVYGLKLAQMLMPGPGHRIDALDDLQNRYYDEFPLPGERGSSALGVVGAFGLLSLLGVAVLSLVRQPTGLGEVRIRQLSTLALPGLLVATIGGISTFVGLFLSSQIRSWNRISIFLGFLALAATGLIVDGVVQRVRQDRQRLTAAAAAAAILVIGVLDQTNAYWTPEYARVNHAFLADQAYFRAVEARLPRSASVFQLPRMVFPESPPVGELGSYGLLKPYLHTDHLRWSFGGIKGRVESLWQDRLPDPATDSFLSDLAAAGFDGLYVDRGGYDDDGKAVESVVTRVTGGAAPFVSEDGRKAFYDLRDYADRIRSSTGAELARRREELLFPIVIEQSREFYGPEPDAGGARWWAVGPDAVLSLNDATRRREQAVVSFDIRTATGRPATFRIRWPDGERQTVQVGESPVRITRQLSTDRGQSSIVIESDAACLPKTVDPRDLCFHLLGPSVSPA